MTPSILSARLRAAKLVGSGGASVVHFAGHGHSVYFEDPDGFNYAVMDFLQGNVPSGTAHPKDGWL